jgi:hypothetical protein
MPTAVTHSRRALAPSLIFINGALMQAETLCRSTSIICKGEQHEEDCTGPGHRGDRDAAA